MKTSLIGFASLLCIGSSSLACPNLTGNYIYQTTAGQTTLAITQNLCASVTFVVTATATSGLTSSATYFVPTDGYLHQVGTSNGVIEYMSMVYNGTQLDSMSVWAQNGVPTPVVTSSTDVFALDAFGNFVDTITGTNGVTASGVTQVVYTRQTPLPQP